MSHLSATLIAVRELDSNARTTTLLLFGRHRRRHNTPRLQCRRVRLNAPPDGTLRHYVNDVDLAQIHRLRLQAVDIESVSLLQPRVRADRDRNQPRILRVDLLDNTGRVD